MIHILARVIWVGLIAASAHAQTIGTYQRRAADLFVAVTGLRVGIDDPRVLVMEKLLIQGNVAGAARLAAEDPAFVNVRVQNMAKKMSDRDELVTAPLSDFVATFAGVARDGADARELLTGNYYYAFDVATLSAVEKANIERATGTTLASGATTPVADFSNDHYVRAATLGLSLHKSLKKFSPQIGIGEGASADAAGVLTSRSFAQAHAEAGTNRRMVEFTFREFMCVSMPEWMDATRPDDWVGRDVDRYAGGGNTRYQVTCKGCHAQLDGFRGAFARLDFPNNKIVFTPAAVASKYARNNTIFSPGYVTTSDTWVNYARGPANSDRFGWRGDKMSGRGAHEFGELIANSQGFSRCLTKRFFDEICKRHPGAADEATVRSIATAFEKTYRIKDLAELVATNPACLPGGAE